MPKLVCLVMGLLMLSRETLQLCTANSCTANYVCNANQYCVLAQNSLVLTEPSISVGAIAGIVLAWLFGLTGLFLFGLWLIFFCFKKRHGDEDGGSSSNQQEAGRPERQRVQTSEQEMQGYGQRAQPPTIESAEDEKYRTKRRKQQETEV